MSVHLALWAKQDDYAILDWNLEKKLADALLFCRPREPYQ
jgi:hypothetical protein